MDLSTTTVLANSGSGSSNLKLDTKSLTWRSTGATQGTIILDFGSPRSVGGLILAFTNLTSTSTIKLVGYNAPNTPSITGNVLTTGIPTVFNTTTLAAPWADLNLPNWGTNPATSSNYSYGGGVYGRVWNSITTPVRYLGIEINNVGSTASYIDISRIIVGSYWSPAYNTEYGIESGISDLSEHMRTDSGDLLTKRGPRFRTLKFNLQWLKSSDRKEVTKIFLGNGIAKPIFISLFPDSTGDEEDFHREDIHQMYGKLSQIPGVSYKYYEFYGTNLEVEEV